VRVARDPPRILNSSYPAPHRSVENVSLLVGVCRRSGGASEGGGLEIGIPEVPEEKGEYVGPVRDLLGDSIGDTVSSIVIHTEEDGVGSSIGGLQA
jgi:hypothetical protein